MEKDYDILFVPITTKMNSLEKRFKEELLNQVLKFPQIAINWLQTKDGLEYANTGKQSLLRRLKKLLKETRIDKNKLHTLLQINYNIGKSYANQSIGKEFVSLLSSDNESLSYLFNGVNDVIDRFERTVVEDVLNLFMNILEFKPGKKLLTLLKEFATQNITTKVSAENRSEMIARTEMQRSFNNGVLQTYSNYGIMLFDIVNYNDIGVCSTCIDIINNNPYTMEEVMKLLPVHPHCRCLCVLFKTNMSLDDLRLVENPMIVNMFA